MVSFAEGRKLREMMRDVRGRRMRIENTKSKEGWEREVEWNARQSRESRLWKVDEA